MVTMIAAGKEKKKGFQNEKMFSNAIILGPNGSRPISRVEIFGHFNYCKLECNYTRKLNFLMDINTVLIILTPFTVLKVS